MGMCLLVFEAVRCLPFRLGYNVGLWEDLFKSSVFLKKLLCFGPLSLSHLVNKLREHLVLIINFYFASSHQSNQNGFRNNPMLPCQFQSPRRRDSFAHALPSQSSQTGTSVQMRLQTVHELPHAVELHEVWGVRLAVRRWLRRRKLTCLLSCWLICSAEQAYNCKEDIC